MRGLVSLSIALTHIQLAVLWWPDGEVLGALRASWAFAIEFFFVLGGFVAFLPIVVYGAFGGVRAYALRRAGRILPLYWVALALPLALYGWLNVGDAPHDAKAVLVHLLFLQEVVYPGETGFGVQLILWSMTIVAFFYVTFPLIVRWYLRHPFLGLACAIAVTAIWRLTTDGNDKVFEQYPLYVADFALGMTAAGVYVRARRAPRLPLSSRWVLAVVAVGLVAFVAMLYASGLPVARGEQLYRHGSILLAVGVPATFAMFLVLIPFLPRWAQRPLDNRFARWMGSISYGMFMLHYIVIWVVIRVTDIPRDGSLTSLIELAVLVLPITFGLAWLATRYVEEPIRRATQRWAERARMSEPAPARLAPGAAVAD